MQKACLVLFLGLLLWGAQAQETQDSGTESTDDIGSEQPEKSDPPKKPTVLSLEGLSATVYAADGKKESSKKGNLGDKLFNAVALSTGQSIEVAFKPLLGGEASKPQQAMLMAASKAHPGLAAYAVAKAKKDGSHVATLNTAAVEKQLGSLGGELELSLLLGDPAAPLGLSGSLGSVVLPEGATGTTPNPKLLTAAHQPINNFKHNIAHIFRSPDKRAPAAVSLAFTCLALAPLGLLVVYLGTLGVNLKGVPSGAGSVWVLLFHVCIAAMLVLYLLFWLSFNLAQTLPVALGLGCLVAVTGYKALEALSTQRIMESKASSGPIAAKKAN